MNIQSKTIPEGDKTDWTRIDTEIEFDGRKIKLPNDPSNMEYDTAIDTIARVRDQENQTYDVSELVKGAPWDTLVAVYLAMQEIYGVVLAESRKTFFGEIKPDFVTVHTGPNPLDRIQVPMGQMSLPGVDAPVHVTMSASGTYIQGTVRRRDRARLVEISNLARKIIREKSVYKAKAIRLNVDSDGDIQLDVQPEFLNLAGVNESDIIHTDETEALIRTNVFAPLKHTEACRRNHIPLKRGILLEGRYGTGKSLTARVTAKIAIDNGWTFIMLNRSQGLKSAIEFAQQYQPCVIFAEDIDRAADREDESVNDLVNTLDGLITKSMEMMVVLTTNFIEKIDKSLLRPGRFDAVISIDEPDSKTAQRIVRAYAGELLGVDEDLSRVGEVTAGMIPASIREVVERAKLSMLVEGRDIITPDDLYISAIGMQRHMALLNPPASAETDAELFARGFLGLLGGSLELGTDDLATTQDVDSARSRIMSQAAKMNSTLTKVGTIAAAGAAASNDTNEYVKRNL